MYTLESVVLCEIFTIFIFFTHIEMNWDTFCISWNHARCESTLAATSSTSVSFILLLAPIYGTRWWSDRQQAPCLLAQRSDPKMVILALFILKVGTYSYALGSAWANFPNFHPHSRCDLPTDGHCPHYILDLVMSLICSHNYLANTDTTK